MIKKFFHSLNTAGIDYILISGQATVLYGAATFSEDIDLWIEPETENWNKFLIVLDEVKAKVYSWGLPGDSISAVLALTHVGASVDPKDRTLTNTIKILGNHMAK